MTTRRPARTSAAAVDSDPRFTVVALAGDAAGAIQAALRERPDVALLDMRMPGSGAAAAWEITARLPAHARGDADRLAQRRGPVRGAARGAVGLPAQGHGVRGDRRRAGPGPRRPRRAPARAGDPARRGVPRQRAAAAGADRSGRGAPSSRAASGRCSTSCARAGHQRDRHAAVRVTRDRAQPRRRGAAQAARARPRGGDRLSRSRGGPVCRGWRPDDGRCRRGIGAERSRSVALARGYEHLTAPRGRGSRRTGRGAGWR